MTITTSPSSHVWNSGFTLTVIASGGTFSPGDTIYFSNGPLSTAFVDSTHLTAVVPANFTSTNFTDVLVAVQRGSTTLAVTSFQPTDPPAGSYSVSPGFVTLGDGDTTLTINGSNFDNVVGPTVKIGGTSLSVTPISATKCTAVLTAAQMVSIGAGAQTLQVANPTPGGGGPGSTIFNIYNLTPSLTSISPTSCPAGSAPFTLTVKGSNFNANSVIYWNGSPRTTVLDSSTQLHCTISAADVVAGGSFPVKVRTANARADSNAINFLVATTNPAPTLGSLSPTGAATGGASFTLTATGTGFVSGSVLRWNGSNRVTTYVSPTQVTAAISASDIAAAGAASVAVFNPAPGGGLSNAIAFNISAPNPVPVLNFVSPASANTGDTDKTVTIDGQNFNTSSVVRWNNADLVTTYVGSTRLTAVIPTADMASPTTGSITVFNPAPAGGTSAPFSFVVSTNNPVPAVISVSPNEVQAGAAGISLSVVGTGFIAASVGQINGASRTTVFNSPTSLTVTIPSSDFLAAGILLLTVFNTTPGGGTSVAVPITVDAAANPVPAITSLSPSSLPRGGGDFVLTVNGSGFVPSTTIEVNGTLLPVTYVSGNRVTVLVPASLYGKAPGSLLKMNPEAAK